MTKCPECGFRKTGEECEMCDSDELLVEEKRLRENVGEEAESAPTGLKGISTWWRAVAIGPVLLGSVFMFGAYRAALPWVPYWMIITVYSVALLLDLRYVYRYTTGWRPNKPFWFLYVAVNIFAAGLLSYLVTPYYVYKRVKAVTPEHDDSDD